MYFSFNVYESEYIYIYYTWIPPIGGVSGNVVQFKEL